MECTKKESLIRLLVSNLSCLGLVVGLIQVLPYIPLLNNSDWVFYPYQVVITILDRIDDKSLINNWIGGFYWSQKYWVLPFLLVGLSLSSLKSNNADKIGKFLYRHKVAVIITGLVLIWLGSNVKEAAFWLLYYLSLLGYFVFLLLLCLNRHYMYFVSSQHQS
jgi:hypothetical protein